MIIAASVLKTWQPATTAAISAAGITSNIGLTAGGNRVTITGSGFLAYADTVMNFPYAANNTFQTFTAPVTADYTVEAWGAAGGAGDVNNNFWHVADKGAYTKGTIHLAAGETLYIYVGQKGADAAGSNAAAAGWNGGGNGGTDSDLLTYGENGGGGGGATDIRLTNGAWNDAVGLRGRIMTAAGAGGTSGSNTNDDFMSAPGAYGGALSANAGPSSGLIPGALSAVGATQTGGSAFGTGGTGGSGSTSFGYNWAGGGGGGGYWGGIPGRWYNAGTSSSNDNHNASGGGGSSYISGYTGSVAVISAGSNSPRTGSGGAACATGTADNLCSQHYSGKVFTDTQMTAGNASMPNPAGGTMIGNAGDGYARITFSEQVMPEVQFGSAKTDLCTNMQAVSDTKITCDTPAHAAGKVDVKVTVGADTVTMTSAYTYVAPATSFTNECYDGGAWTVYPYVAQGQTVECRLALNGPFSGEISLRDDYADTIDSSLSGAFASAESRFSAGTFTLAYADTIAAEDRTLSYTYTSPAAGTLSLYYDDDDAGDGDYVGNGYDLYWPLILLDIDTDYAGYGITNSGEDDVMFGLLAEEYRIYPNAGGDTNATYCTDCESAFIISTHGAPYLGSITLNDDLSDSDNPGGAHGIFGVGGQSGSVVDMSELDGADSGFTYTPKVTAASPKRVRLLGTSAGPAIADHYYDIAVVESGLTISGAPTLKRGETGGYTLAVTLGSGWSGTVTLSDVFNVGGNVGGTFADTTTGTDITGTFNAASKTYSFTAGPNETYTRTFEYTLRDDSAAPPNFPSYIVNLTGNSDTPTATGFTPVFISADKLSIKCGAGYPTCAVGYVGESKDYAISPNGMMVGSAAVTAGGGGALSNAGLASWNSATSFVLSYTPNSPGRKTLTATVNAGGNSDMVGQSYASTDADSLNDYIWVMANEMSVAGDANLAAGQSGNYILTLNGPFVGTVSLSDVLSDGIAGAGGAFSNGGFCTFALSDYNVGANTTDCAFTYTPAAQTVNTAVMIRPASAVNYGHTVGAAPISVLVRAPLTVTGVNTNSGNPLGGEQISVFGTNFTGIGSVKFGGIDCASFTIINSTRIDCVTPAHAAGYVGITVANIYGDTDTLADSFLYRSMELILDDGGAGKVSFTAPSDGSSVGSGSLALSVTTNYPTGYNLYLRADDLNDGTDNDDYLVCKDDAAYSYSPASGSLTAGQWGYGVGGATPSAWKSVALTDTVFTSSAQPSGSDHDGLGSDDYRLWFGARGAYTLPACDYQVRVIITMAVDL